MHILAVQVVKYLLMIQGDIYIDTIPFMIGRVAPPKKMYSYFLHLLCTVLPVITVYYDKHSSTVETYLHTTYAGYNNTFCNAL